jgi:multicomponent Na+:H+ antiporter subunit D
MVELGVYGVARVYWTMFADVPGAHGAGLRAILLGFGTVGALVGAMMCFLQRHLKRLLAYSTISHAGIFLIGVALLSPKGLAGAGVYVLSHGLLKGALFLCVGILLNQLNSVDELKLRGEARALVPTGVVFALCGLALAGPPPLGTFLGKSLIEESATKLGYGWVPVVLTVASIVTSGAILRAAGRVFLGLGREREPYLSPEPDEEREVERNPERSPALMILPAAAIALAGVGLSLVPGLEHHAERAAHRFQDSAGYVAAVLHGHVQQPPVLSFELLKLPTASVLWGLASALGAVLLALVALYRERLVPAPARRALVVTRPGVEVLRTLHSGAIGDYITWLTVGVAALGGLLTLALR